MRHRAALKRFQQAVAPFQMVAATSKAPHLPPPFDPLRQVRLSEPRHALQTGKGVGKHFPKLPANPSPGPPAPQLSPARHSLHVFLPGPQAPPPKATPRSLSFASLYGSLTLPPQAAVPSSPFQVDEPPQKAIRLSATLALPRTVEEVSFATSQVQNRERMEGCLHSFICFPILLPPLWKSTLPASQPF